MLKNLRGGRGRLEALAYAVPAFIYIVIAIPVTIRQRAAINPDGIIYIRKAQFLLAGHFWQSISGYWSPGISWCVALLIGVVRKIDPLHAIHAVLAVWGLTWVLASCAALASLLPRRPTWRLLAGIAFAFSGVRQAVSLITPDLLLGTMLMAYLATVSSNGLLTSRGKSFAAGLFAGLGYLCKSYALPFFCLHFPLTVAYRYWCARRGKKWDLNEAPEQTGGGGFLAIFLLGVVGFALPALPWVGLLSHKYGHFTISMVYHHNHMNVGDTHAQETLPDFCVVPPDPYLSIWEGLDPGPRSDWSPFSSMENLKHQIAIAFEHAWEIIRNIASFDYWCVTLIAILLTLFPFHRKLGRPLFSAVPLWIVMTCCVYCLGFLVVAFEVRYIVPILLPLGLGLCLREREDFAESEPEKAATPFFQAAPWAVVALYAISAFLGMGQFAFDSPARPMYANVAALLRKKHLDGLFTSSENNKGVDVSYFLNRKIVLIPFGDDIDKIQRELFAAGVGEILVWTDKRTDTPDSYPRMLTEKLLHTGLWRLALGQKLDSVRRIDVYVLKSSASTMPATEEPQQD